MENNRGLFHRLKGHKEFLILARNVSKKEADAQFNAQFNMNRRLVFGKIFSL